MFGSFLDDCSSGLKVSVKVVSLNIHAGLVGKFLLKDYITTYYFNLQSYKQIMSVYVLIFLCIIGIYLNVRSKTNVFPRLGANNL